MVQPKKMTLGVRPNEKMFRIASLGGSITDAILALRNVPPLDSTYFTTVQHSGHSIRLSNEDKGNYLIIDVENIVFVHDRYDSDKQINEDEFFSAFNVIWRGLQKLLAVKDVRRVGYVAEYRFAQQQSSAHLMNGLTKLGAKGVVDKFSLRYEMRKGTGPGGLPDPVKDDFLNFIRVIYDSSADIDHPEPDHFNANLDVQRYYSPSFNGDVTEECRSVRAEFARQLPALMADLERVGLTHAKAA